MARQRRLPLVGEEILEELWEGFPLVARQRLIQIYASLMARAAGLAVTPKESEHGPIVDRSARQDSR